ncbi:MAG: Diacylglycerol kinase family enzyme [Parcubacteria group bacterium GW2011_GWE2_39_37]|uniref:Diacylglycerol kinase family enzyme n=1 Tax=Candidatus Falkowbacteria bacterium GW2011_GWF2_39_8 TaxID=1618642 RepID=A0A0G0Q8S1_9BACT|nr:MAG: Diacylglycerol kinase family enzyme [Parcubacteria group bacterium GW2011_GWE2_39_37]KKR33711.1 MAG: Diacylglycerol kinase family enzyme [Candidatus Falkowbacteria bacterium GW2011_GWF2_39_8]
MHVYIYDSFLNHNKYHNLLAKIETRITDLGLNGKICRLGASKNYSATIQDEIKRGAKTIIAVGNDETINQVINAMNGSEIPLGIIPVGKNESLVATSLGIGRELLACDILSARRIEKLDLVLANDTLFLTEGKITTKGSIIEINQGYSIEILEGGEVSIINLPLSTVDLPTTGKFKPDDGLLEVFIKTKETANFLKKSVGQSVFTTKELTLDNKSYLLRVDNSIDIKTPIKIKSCPQSLNVIVGKNRTF